MRYKLQNSNIHYLQPFKYNLKGDFSWNGPISIKEWKIEKNFQFIQDSWTFLELIFCKKICSNYAEVWLRIEKLNH